MPPLVLIAGAWVAGLLIAKHGLAPSGVEPLSLLPLLLIPVAALCLWRTDRTIQLGAWCGLALLLGGVRYLVTLPDLDDPHFVAHYNDSGWANLEGVIRGYPDVRDTWTDLHIETQTLVSEGKGRAVQGTILIRVPRYPEYHYGDRLLVSGLLQTPPELEGFSYKGYLARRGIYSIINRPQVQLLDQHQGSPVREAIYRIKDLAREAIARLVPEPEASLLHGILLGIRSGISRDLYDDYNATGTSHIIVISGSNISYISSLFALIFGRILGKRRAYWFTVAGIIVYVLLVGGDAAVVRAGIMGGLYITAVYLGRRSTGYVSLCASAVVLTFITPYALWDVGFQLSFAATLGLFVFTPALERLFERGLTRLRTPEPATGTLHLVRETLILTLAAQILTVPLTVYHFGRLSLIAPLANILILPVQPPIMALGGAAAIVGLVPALQPLAQGLAWIPWLCLTYTNAVVRWMASWPSVSLEIDHRWAIWFVLAYGALVLLVLWIYRKRRNPARTHERVASQRSSNAFLAGMAAIAVLVFLAAIQMPDGRLHVVFLDVGQGDAIFITTPSGKQVLVDGGPSPSKLTEALGRYMPFWDRSLDVVVMTHADVDHITGLAEMLARYRLSLWLDNGQPGDGAVYATCQRLLQANSVHQVSVRAGDRLDLGSGIRFEVLHPPADLPAGLAADDNDTSLVLRLVWREASFLLASDVSTRAEHLIQQSDQLLAADVLKVAHHGSEGSSSAEFLTAVNPSYAVISVGADNPFGHPGQAILERLGNVTLLRTDQQGTVELITDGHRLWVRTQR
jgi:competence protein ComEC